QLPRFRMLLSRPVDRGGVVSLGLCCVSLARHQPSFEGEDLRVTVAFFPARSLDLRDAFVDQLQRAIDIALLGEPFGQNRLEKRNNDTAAARFPDGESGADQRDPGPPPPPPNPCAAKRRGRRE